MRKQLDSMPQMAKFRTSEYSLILVKSHAEKGDKIGAYNPFGQLIWIPKNSVVIVVE